MRDFALSLVLALTAGATGAEPMQDAMDAEKDASPQTGSAEEGAVAETVDATAILEEPPFPIHGYASMRYLLRSGGDDSDQDLRWILNLDAGDPERNPVTFHFLGRLGADLDGSSQRFFSLDDTEDGTLTPRFYEAYADLHRLGPIELFRIGRHYFTETLTIVELDGARLETPPIGDLGLKLGAYGGIPVHPYESSRSGDWLVGGFGEIRPWAAARLVLEGFAAQSHRDDTTLDDQLFGLSVWQGLGEGIELFGRYTLLDAESRDLLLRGSYTDVDADLRAQLRLYTLFTTQVDLVDEIDPYSETLFALEPYVELAGTASQGLGDHVVVDFGFAVRELTDADDEGEFNHDFTRLFLTPTVVDLPVDGMTIALTGDIWEADDRRVGAVGLDVTQRFSTSTRASIGTAYSLYKFDVLTESERNDVRTYYVSVVHDLNDAWRLDAELAFEHDTDFGDTTALRIGAAWSF